METVDFEGSTVWKTRYIDTNQEIQANEINQSMKDAESVGSRDESIILAEWNYVSKSFETIKTLAPSLHTLFGSSYSCEAFFSRMNFIRSSTRNRLGADMSAACVKSINPGV